MPSEKVLKEKQGIVAELADKMQNAAAGVFVSYSGLTVEKDTELRNNFRAAGVEYSVVKNTLTRRAAEQIGYTEFDEILNGTTALAIHNDDVVAPAKVLSEFIAKYKDESGLTIKAGFMDGKACGVDEINALAKIPSKDTLYAMLAGGLNATIAGLARAIQAVADKDNDEATA